MSIEKYTAQLLSSVTKLLDDGADDDYSMLECFLKGTFDPLLDYRNMVVQLQIKGDDTYHVIFTRNINSRDRYLLEVTGCTEIKVDRANQKIVECSNIQLSYELEDTYHDTYDNLEGSLRYLNIPKDFEYNIDAAINSDEELKSAYVKSIENKIFFGKL